MRIPSLVSARWLAKNLLNSKYKAARPLCVVDATWRLSEGTTKAKNDYFVKHIPGAVFFDLDECCDKKSQLPHMLPNQQVFTEYLQYLGITNKCTVIAYDNNPDYGMFSAPRLWWMLRYFGHDTVALLDGGLKAWSNGGFPLEGGEEFITDVKEPFNTKLNANLVRDYDTMVSNVEAQGQMFPVVDARGPPRFKGHQQEPRAGLKSGHIPHAINIPFTECLDDDNMFFKDVQQLKDIFEGNNVDLKKPFTTSCGSGISACVVSFAAHLCGQDQVSVYDGSWSEWGLRAPLNMIVKEPQ